MAVAGRVVIAVVERGVVAVRRQGSLVRYVVDGGADMVHVRHEAAPVWVVSRAETADVP
jgi:hypothetical protein